MSINWLVTFHSRFQPASLIPHTAPLQTWRCETGLEVQESQPTRRQCKGAVWRPFKRTRPPTTWQSNCRGERSSHQSSHPIKKEKDRKEKIKGSWPRTCIQYTRLHMVSIKWRTLMLCSRYTSLTLNCPRIQCRDYTKHNTKTEIQQWEIMELTHIYASENPVSK